MYTVSLSPNARKGIRRLAPEIRRRVRQAIDALETDPRPHNVAKLRGYEQRYRIRVGKDYRIVYDIFDDQLLVVVVEAGHRRHIYR